VYLPRKGNSKSFALEVFIIPIILIHISNYLLTMVRIRSELNDLISMSISTKLYCEKGTFDIVKFLEYA
jgi:hypothetical protein